MNFKKFLSLDVNYSSMRLSFILCVVTGCLGGMSLCIIDLFINQGKNIATIAIVIASYLGPAFLGKVGQTKIEKN